MKQKINNMFLYSIIALFQFVNPIIASETLFLDTCNEENHLQDETFLVSPQDLHIDEATITIDIDGVAYPVDSLKRQGNQWLVKLARVNYCPKGHLTCQGCGQCHTEKCWYFVRHCKLW